MPRKTPTPFDALLTAPVNTLAEQAIDEGRIAIGYTCSYVPTVLLSVPPLRDAGYRVLSLEREYAATGMGQLQTRIQAFLESMGK